MLFVRAPTELWLGLYDELPYAAHIVTSWVILEAQIDLADLMLFGMTFKMQSADALARLVAFVVEVMTQEGSVGLQSRLRSLLQGTASNPATEAEAALVAFAKAPSFPLAIEALRAFRVTAAHGYRTQPALAAETDGTAAAPVVQRQQPTLPPKLPWSSYSLSASANGSGSHSANHPSASPRPIGEPSNSASSSSRGGRFSSAIAKTLQKCVGI